MSSHMLRSAFTCCDFDVDVDRTRVIIPIEQRSKWKLPMVQGSFHRPRHLCAPVSSSTVVDNNFVQVGAEPSGMTAI